MTRSLYVLRHAKAEDSAPAGGGDRERPLERRGKKAARLVGRTLTRLEEQPHHVLSSNAERARDTARLAIEEGGWDVRLELAAEIYEATAEALRRRIAAAPDDARRLLLVGHQPGLSLLIADLTGCDPVFPTAALARIDFSIAYWGELAPGQGRLVWLFTPEVMSSLRARKKE